MSHLQQTLPTPTATSVHDSPAVAPVLLTIADAARVLSIGRTTLYALIGDGAIPVVHIGRSTRVPVLALHEFVAQRQAAE